MSAPGRAGRLFAHGVRRLVPREIRSHRLGESLAAADAWIAPDALERDDGEPIFLLSAGWRSGSTWVQRLLCSDDSALVWGEPFGEAIPVPRLASMLEAFLKKAPRRAADAYEAVAAAEGDAPLAERWIANLNPGFAALRASHKAFLDRLLAAPAKDHGFQRWGAKWVRLTADHARYLRWLYPRARLVFLVRDPLDAWASYAGRRWYTVNPVARVEGPLAFGAHWAHLAGSFADQADELGALLVRYEDLLRDPAARERLAGHCGVELAGAALEAKLRGPDRSPPSQLAARLRRRVVAGVTAPVRRRLGYPLRD